MIQTARYACSMDGTFWQQRAKAAGLSQRTLARLLGHAEITISRQLRGHWQSGIPRHVIAAIIAWEMMTPEQRDMWVKGVKEASAAEAGESEGEAE